MKNAFIWWAVWTFLCGFFLHCTAAQSADFSTLTPEQEQQVEAAAEEQVAQARAKVAELQNHLVYIQSHRIPEIRTRLEDGKAAIELLSAQYQDALAQHAERTAASDEDTRRELISRQQVLAADRATCEQALRQITEYSTQAPLSSQLIAAYDEVLVALQSVLPEAGVAGGAV